MKEAKKGRATENTFVAKVRKSFRIQIPTEVVEYLGLEINDMIKVTIKKE